ncbi:MAG: hypothetical protein ACPGXK_11465 [Phycisphaerae bacterium]
MTEIPQVKTALSSLPDDADRFVAVAPGRLDVMGGSAVYTGSLALSIPLSSRAFAVAQRRTDGMVAIKILQTKDAMHHVNGSMFSPHAADAGSNGSTANGHVQCREVQVNVDASLFAKDDGSALKSASEGADGECTSVIGAIFMALSGLMRAAEGSASSTGDTSGGDRARFGGGLTLIVGTDMAHRKGAGCAGAIGAAVVAAGGCALGLELDSAMVPDLMGGAHAGLTPTPVSASDVLSGMFGSAGQLTQLRNDPCSFAMRVPIPDDVCIVGVDSGAPHDKASEKYWQMRTTVSMGRELLARIIRHDCPEKAQWDGFLSRISVTDFVERFRDRIPTRLKGGEFIKLFGNASEPGCEIDKNQIYKVRSRTEHHIYEHERALQFAHHTTRLGRMKDITILDELGELMFASHWSYGQRCGLGSIQADSMVTMLRQQRDQGIYGAKITANGCGGMVAVLMDRTQQASDALRATVATFNEQEGRNAAILESDGAGIMETGVARI